MIVNIATTCAGGKYNLEKLEAILKNQLEVPV